MDQNVQKCLKYAICAYALMTNQSRYSFFFYILHKNGNDIL